ncbi:MAG: hypothetical protein RJB26_1326 [Pseudomonadota bacterium]|jgi:hypothetical protein
MKSTLQGCTETYFKNAYAARRHGQRDKVIIESLVVMAHNAPRRIGRAALKVLREVRDTRSTPTAA